MVRRCNRSSVIFRKQKDLSVLCPCLRFLLVVLSNGHEAQMLSAFVDRGSLDK
jgi:hypothetical protein